MAKFPGMGRGKKLEHPATLEEALLYGDLDWEVKLVELHTTEGQSVPMRRAVVRLEGKDSPHCGNSRLVLGVVHPEFKPLQNRQGVETFDAIFGRGARVYHTGGYLGEGEVVWLLARLPADLTLAGSDIIEPYVLYSNSHNGSRAIDFRLTAVRVVCQNTLNLALHTGDRAKVFKRNHNGSYNRLQEEFNLFFQFTIDALQIAQGRFERLSQARCAPDAFRQFVEAIFKLPQQPANPNPAVQRAYQTRKEQMLTSRQEVEKRWNKENDDGLITVRGTWWGALNAVTAHVDHDLAPEQDSLAYTVFGPGNDLKNEAYDLAVASMA